MVYVFLTLFRGRVVARSSRVSRCFQLPTYDVSSKGTKGCPLVSAFDKSRNVNLDLCLSQRELLDQACQRRRECMSG